MASKRLMILGLLLWLLLALPPSAKPVAAAGPSGSMKIEFQNGLLSLEAREEEVGDLLLAIAEKAGIALTIGDGVAGRVSLALENVTLEEALRRLCASRAIVYEYDPEARTFRVIRAGAFAAAAGPGAAETDEPAAALPPAMKPAAGVIPLVPGGVRPAGDGGERLYDSRGRLRYKPRELLVRFAEEATAEAIEALHRALGSTVLKVIGPRKLYSIRLREGLSEKEGLALYGVSGIVAAVERHGLRYPLKTPNDPYFASDQWNLKQIGMPAAWDITTGKTDVVVAVIDTGVDILHPDLAANIWTNSGEIPSDGIDNDGNGCVDDVHGWDFTGTVQSNGDNNPIDPASPIPPIPFGHGTHVAGIIAAAGNNGIGVAGVGWNLRIMALKVLADDAATMEILDIIAAIDYAIANGARIVNCSFGAEASFDQMEHDAFASLRQAGILAVCAGGNYGKDNDTADPRMYPASYDLDNIVSVAFSDQADRLAGGSNYGRTSVDLMAPGEAIRSTLSCSWGCTTPECSACKGVDYPVKSGSSFAAPHVSGVAGLILSRKPELGYAQVKSILLENVDKIAAVSDKLASGGRLNAVKALSQVCYPGEVTGRSGIGLADVILALRIAAGMGSDVPVCRMADVNGDGRIDLAEAIYDLQVLSGFRN